MATRLVGLVGWRGMVGSVLMDRMQQENDFALIEPVFFSTSNIGGKAPAFAKNETTLQDGFNIDALEALRHHHHRPGRRLHHRGVPQAARRRLERPLDRRRFHAAHEGRCGHHPRPGQHAGHQEGAGQGRQELDRRQLHGELHADGRGRAVQGRPGRVDEHADLPGRLGWRRAAHARVAHAVRHAQRRSEVFARRPQERHPGDRSQGHRQAAQPERSRDGQLRRAAGRQPDPLDRQGSGQRHEQGRVEGRRRDQQDPRVRAKASARPPCRSMASACVWARCAATARR